MNTEIVPLEWTKPSYGLTEDGRRYVICSHGPKCYSCGAWVVNSKFYKSYRDYGLCNICMNARIEAHAILMELSKEAPKEVRRTLKYAAHHAENPNWWLELIMMQLQEEAFNREIARLGK